MKLDKRARYTPDSIITHRGHGKVNSIKTFPPNAHPEGCPLVQNCTAVQLVSDAYGSRWYGVERAYINSELRMIVIGFDARFEEMAAWKRVPANRLA